MADGDANNTHREQSRKNCIFCQIAAKEKDTTIVYEDDNITVFPDIRPAAKHHYLVIPKTHVGNPKSLSREDVGLVERLITVGKQVLQERDADTTDARLGFHWPPFNSVQHLHLHVISPVSEMGFIGRHVYRPDSWWFVTASWLLEFLGKQTDSHHCKSGGVDEKKKKSSSL